MRSSSSRLFLCAAAAALVGLAGQAGAAPAPPGPKPLVIKDPAGDSAPGADMDITQVVVTTSGKVAKVGRKQVYTPDALVFTMSLASAPSALPIANYEIKAMTNRCGEIWLYFDAQNLFSGGQVACGEEADPTGDPSTSFPDGPVVKGKDIVWTIPFAQLPKEMKVGTTITDFHAYVALGEPANGTTTETILPALNPDNVDAPDTYKIG